uniref:Immunoglobulin V-set domain-containing protein n=1 Tax=Chelonoidis abingdonii TaxID=106734 RepID=A0A8C0GXR9_CHEAB
MPDRRRKMSSTCSATPNTVNAAGVLTPEELFVENGTEARLPCTFSSSEVISCATSVSWSVQPEGATTPISVRALCLG